VYNRGVEKREIFLEEIDYGVLLSYVKTYLLPKDTHALMSVIANPIAGWRQKDQAIKALRLNNFSDSIELVAFCFMKNHYHMLIRQENENDMDQFMNSLWTRYTMYFNKKYKRVGPLFQDVYKAVLVKTEEQLMYLTRYIHRNPIAKRQLRNSISQRDALRNYVHSSYLNYVGERKATWIHSERILAAWNLDQYVQYEKFVLEFGIEERSAKIIAPVII